MEKAQVVIEELMYLAIDAGRKAATEATRGDLHARGRLFAYHDILDVLQQQARLLGLQFEDKSLAAFDPDDLMRTPREAA